MEDRQQTVVPGPASCLSRGKGIIQPEASAEEEMSSVNPMRTTPIIQGEPPLLPPTTSAKNDGSGLCESRLQQRATTAPQSISKWMGTTSKAKDLNPALPICPRRVIFPSHVKTQSKSKAVSTSQGMEEVTSKVRRTNKIGSSAEKRAPPMVAAPRHPDPRMSPVVRVSQKPHIGADTASSVSARVGRSTSNLESKTAQSRDQNQEYHRQNNQRATSSPSHRPIISLPMSLTDQSCNGWCFPIVRLPLALQSSKPPLTTATKSIMRQQPKYAPPQTTSSLSKKSEESSIPSLVDIKEESDDDASQSSSDHDAGKENAVVAFAGQSLVNAMEEPSCTASETSQTPSLVNPGPEAPPDVAIENDCRRVRFSALVWIREFHRSSEEFACAWYTDDDMDRFRKMVLERILRYQSSTEIIGTGTGRTIQRSVARWTGPIYSHAALTLDGENDNDAYMKQKVLEKELSRVMIVDPHDMCLNLFAKTIKRIMPRGTNIATATSSEEALKLLEQGKRFDMIIVEERLGLFHRQNSASKMGIAQRSNSFCTELTSSGSALIKLLSKSPLTSNSLLIGVSAHLKEDKAELQKSGADFCWTKPPPTIDEDLLGLLLKTVLTKRGRSVLGAELYG